MLSLDLLLRFDIWTDLLFDQRYSKRRIFWIQMDEQFYSNYVMIRLGNLNVKSEGYLCMQKTQEDRVITNDTNVRY